MARDNEASTLPPKVRAAFDFLHHTRMVTEQVDASIPMRSLSAMERSVEQAALRVLQQYLLGEMEFSESSIEAPEGKKGDEGDAPETVPTG